MIEVASEVAPDALVEGFAACLASVVEVPVTEVPVPDDDLRHALGAWRTWLAEYGSGLVPITEPRSFEWPGWWIAVVRCPSEVSEADAEAEGDAVAALAFGTPAGIVLSPQAPALLGRATAELPVLAGFAVASLDPVVRPGSAAPVLRGTVEGLAVAPAAEAPIELREAVQARAGRGLEGDRYADGIGTFSPRAGWRPGYDLTLVAAEVLEELAGSGHPVEFGATRRNVLSRGLDVNALVGRRFLVGDVLCQGRRLCEPCAHLERLSGPGLLRPLIHRGGLRVDVLTDGPIKLGAPIRSL